MIPKIRLNNNSDIPALGFGTWRSDKDKVGDAVKAAIGIGYRHIDCASIYGNEKEIGEALAYIIKEETVKREELFVTSKLWNTDHHPDNVEKACKQTLSDLKLEYLDLYLIHWGIAFESGGDLEPVGEDGLVLTEPVSIEETWQAMESLVKKGLVKSIGVANFTTTMIVDLLSYAEIKPVVNQVEIHPYNTQSELVDYCHKKQIAITAYSPLGSIKSDENRPISDSVVLAIAQKHKASPAQVLIKWSLQRGLAVIPKSINVSRIEENLNSVRFKLSEKDMEDVNGLNKNHRFVDPVKWWGVPYFK